MQRVHQLLKRIKAIDWSQGPAEANADDIALAKQYLDGVAFLYEAALNSKGHLSPIFSPASCHVNRDTLLSRDERNAVDTIQNKSSNAYEAALLANAIEWAKLCDLANPITVGREALFEPLLTLIEKRIYVGMRKGFFVVDENMFPLANWPSGYGPFIDKA